MVQIKRLGLVEANTMSGRCFVTRGGTWLTTRGGGGGGGGEERIRPS